MVVVSHPAVVIHSSPEQDRWSARVSPVPLVVSWSPFFANTPAVVILFVIIDFSFRFIDFGWYLIVDIGCMVLEEVTSIKEWEKLDWDLKIISFGVI